MDFKESRIYKNLIEEPFHKVAKKVLRLTEEGRDVNFTGDNGDTYLHVVAAHADKFRDPRAVPVVYQLCLSGINVNTKNEEGNTCLHLVIRHGGVYRIVVGLLRCGADPLVTDKQGRTAEDILTAETPDGWEETLYWLKKYSPGVHNLLKQSPVDTEKLEKLLLSWSRLLVTLGGDTVNLLDQCKSAENANENVIRLLERYMYTNELAIATLAGSPKNIAAAAASNERANINTGDNSYRYHYKHSPEVVQPLLAAAWEQDNYDVIDAVMLLSPDTRVLYSNHSNRSKKPVLFHILSGTPKPENLALVHRVLRGSDLSVRNHKGQTVLFEAVHQRLPVTIFVDILTYGADLASRDYKGRTVRDYAESLGYVEYVKAVDKYVIQMVDDMNVDVIEGWVARDYDHVSDVVSTELESNERLRERLENNRLYKDMSTCLQGVHRQQRLCRLLMETADKGDVQAIRKHATGYVMECQNKCGQTLLHRTIMGRHKDSVFDMISAFPYLLDIPDTFQRVPIHYACLFFGGSHEISKTMIRMGARSDVFDIYGRSPEDYTKESLTTHQYNTLITEVQEFESKIFLREMDFEAGLSRAIKNGDHGKITELLQKAGSRVKMAAYSQLVFDCIDNNQPEIAIILLQNGCDPDVWKQYEQCEPTSDACVMSKCQHPVVSLPERCKQMGYQELADHIDELRKNKLDPQGSRSDILQSMSNFGILAQA